VKYVRIYNDQHGGAKFADEEVTFTVRDFAPPAPPLEVSEVVSAYGFQMARLPRGWSDPAHPAPARQFMILLSGKVEVVAGGERRIFEAGDVVLLEDTSAPGHGTTALEDAVFAVVRVG
jgi:quercetin dioxygenase-like cupin family protein